MSKRLTVFWLILGLAVGAAACDEDESDGDSDADADFDADEEGDGDAEPVCDPECDEAECLECVAGECVTFCSDGEECITGRCERMLCDPVANSGCEGGDRCAFYSRDEGRVEWDCLPQAIDAPGPGQPCSYTLDDPYYGNFDNCAGGSWCVGGAAGEPTCMALCSESDASFCNEVYPDGEGGFVDGICNLSYVELVGTGILGCLEPVDCDPTCDQPCEGVEDLCLPAGDSGGNFGTICIGMSRDTPGGFAGDACVYANSCQPGFICMGSICTALCDTSLTEAECDPPAVDPDPDGDGVPTEGGDHFCATDETADCDDNCPYTANNEVGVDVQIDTDTDGEGDACAGDFDADTVLNADDNCREIPNLDQADADSDDIGDLCDPDLALCDFSCCGEHPGETGAEVCTVPEGSEETWQTLAPPVGVCIAP